MQKWKAILFASVRVLLLTAVLLSNHAAEAQDFCDTSHFLLDQQKMVKSAAQLEQDVRAKCKVGDLIVPYNDQTAARLCDFRQGTTYQGVCFLAPPRKTY
jgi:hypothetical protein